MPDNVTIDNADLADVPISTDLGGSGYHVQRMKLAYSADGSEAHVPADADGIKVNLSTNNDVTVTGAVNATLQAGTAEFGKLAAGTANIGDVDVLTLPALPTGTNTIGSVKLTDGTTMPTVVDTGGTHDGLAVAIVDAAGEHITMSAPVVITATTSDLDTGALATGDVMTDTKMSWANAVATSGGTGHIIRATAVDESDLGIEFDLYICRDNVSEAAKNDPHALSVADAANVVDKLTFSTWEDHANAQTSTVRPSPPIAFDCAATTLYGVPVTRGAPTYVATNDIKVILHILKD